MPSAIDPSDPSDPSRCHLADEVHYVPSPHLLFDTDPLFPPGLWVWGMWM